MKKKENLSEEEKNRRLAGNAFRRNKKTPKSQMIMIKILRANCIDNLQRTKQIAALAYFVEPDSESLEINYDLVEVLFSVSSALQLTEKTRGWINSCQHFEYFAVPWGFTITPETYDQFINPWWTCDMVSCFSFKVPSLELFTISKTRASCPYCHSMLLAGPRMSTEQMMKHVMKELTKRIHFDKKMLISEEEYRYRKSMDVFQDVYYPPTLETTYLVCPKCKKQVLLRSKFYDSNQRNIYGYTEPPEITEKPLLIDSYNFLEEEGVLFCFVLKSFIISLCDGIVFPDLNLVSST